MKTVIKKDNYIFYADDDVDDLEFFKEVVNEINESVSLFDEGEKLLNALINPIIKPTIIFLDLNMPIKSGFDVLKKLKSSPETENIPVIILTTSNNLIDVNLCKKLGASLYIRKPTTIVSLRKAIQFVIDIDWNNFILNEKEFFYKV